jgi:hypothetical protein
VPLPYSEGKGHGLAEVELFAGSPSRFLTAPQKTPHPTDSAEWFHHVRLGDGSDYLRWTGLFEFLVSAQGRQITCRALSGASQAAFHTYLLNHALSFALLKQGIEPLHATVVVVDDQAVAFLGDCGYGKSSLGAAFLQQGHRLLTDDLLVIEEKDRRFIAHPGPPRIKLFPEIAKLLLGEQASGTPMNPTTPKLVIRLSTRQSTQTAAPLKAIYMLRPPLRGIRRKRITIRSLSQRRACLELIGNTYNTVLTGPDRLAQQFDLAARLAAGIPVKALSYPRTTTRLPAVLETIQADLAQ